MADSSSEKNQKPTGKRLNDARRKGQVARSHDLASAAGLAGATAALAAWGGTLVWQLRLGIVQTLGHLDAVAHDTPGSADLAGLVLSNGQVMAKAAGPVAIAAAVAGLSAFLAQGGLVLSTTSLQPSLGRLSPMNGLRRLAPSKAGLDTLRTIIVASVMGVLTWRIGRELAFDAPRLVRVGLVASSGEAWRLILRLLWQACGTLLALGAVDYGLQRWRLTKSLMMTRQEVQDEVRNNEGRPEVKARIRRIQRDMARRRMLQATARATVVITNPTHFAVALEYRRDKSPAPIVVAKGQDLVAARIREVARLNNVPIIENPRLARALFAETEIGDVIPAPLFGAVAEVLAYLIRIRQLMM
jgi:flagellar biosynthetic protein FlhB